MDEARRSLEHDALSRDSAIPIGALAKAVRKRSSLSCSCAFLTRSTTPSPWSASTSESNGLKM